MLNCTIDRSKALQAEPSAPFVVPENGCFELSSGVSVKNRPPRHRLRSCPAMRSRATSQSSPEDCPSTT